jgi:hypothetical protein
MGCADKNDTSNFNDADGIFPNLENDFCAFISAAIILLNSCKVQWCRLGTERGMEQHVNR